MYNIIIMKEVSNRSDEIRLHGPTGVCFPERCESCPGIRMVLGDLGESKKAAKNLAEVTLAGNAEIIDQSTGEAISDPKIIGKAVVKILEDLDDKTRDTQELVDELTGECKGSVYVKGSNGVVSVEGYVCGSQKLANECGIEAAEVQRELK